MCVGCTPWKLLAALPPSPFTAGGATAASNRNAPTLGSSQSSGAGSGVAAAAVAAFAGSTTTSSFAPSSPLRHNPFTSTSKSSPSSSPIRGVGRGGGGRGLNSQTVGIEGGGGAGAGAAGEVPESFPNEIRSTFCAVMSFVDPSTDLPITSHLRNKGGRHAAAVVWLVCWSCPQLSQTTSPHHPGNRLLFFAHDVFFFFFWVSSKLFSKVFRGRWLNLLRGASVAEPEPGGSPGRRRGGRRRGRKADEAPVLRRDRLGRVVVATRAGALPASAEKKFLSRRRRRWRRGGAGADDRQQGRGWGHSEGRGGSALRCVYAVALPARRTPRERRRWSC